MACMWWTWMWKRKVRRASGTIIASHSWRSEEQQAFSLMKKTGLSVWRKSSWWTDSCPCGRDGEMRGKYHSVVPPWNLTYFLPPVYHLQISSKCYSEKQAISDREYIPGQKWTGKRTEWHVWLGETAMVKKKSIYLCLNILFVGWKSFAWSRDDIYNSIRKGKKHLRAWKSRLSSHLSSMWKSTVGKWWSDGWWQKAMCTLKMCGRWVTGMFVKCASIVFSPALLVVWEEGRKKWGDVIHAPRNKPSHSNPHVCLLFLCACVMWEGGERN